MVSKIAIVTDSTAMLPAEAVGAAGCITVVPLQVVLDGQAYDEGLPETSPEAISEALTGRRKVSTSRPSPTLLGEVYDRLAGEGYDEVISLHLSAEMSGTFESAQIAARTAPVPVTVVDTRGVGPCLGFAVLAAASRVASGGTAQQAVEAALARAAATQSYFYVNTLEHLRRGGRIGAAAALLGSALAVKPLLTIDDGRVVLHERVRTAARALARLEELAVEAAADGPVEVVVAHLGAAERAGELCDHLASRIAEALGPREVRCGELGAVLGAHAGPGMLAVVVAPAL
ncbi:DegV family protein [Nocardioides sp. DS6]|uniref:DegV family protein n=1 Tax=Nocardioides eburneus TaxID=3231482 RepID=A0ABV3T3A2_9ACTN